MNNASADQLNRLGAQLKQAQVLRSDSLAPPKAPEFRGSSLPTDAELTAYAGASDRMRAGTGAAISKLPAGAKSLAGSLMGGGTGKPAVTEDSMITRLGYGARGLAERGTAALSANPNIGGGAAVGAIAGAGFNALRTAVGNIRRKKKGEPTKSVLGGALTGGLVGGGLGAGAGYAMKQAEAVDQLNRLGAHLRSPTT